MKINNAIKDLYNNFKNNQEYILKKIMPTSVMFLLTIFIYSILRGTKDSHVSAVMFGEFFPNPGFAKSIGEIGWVKAMLLEAFGTMLMILAIFGITKNSKENDSFVPWAIGFTVAMLICFVAPFTQAGFNPARDFGPRLIAFFTGWGEHAFPAPSFSFFTVYILGPCLGGVVAVKLKHLIKL